MIRLALAFVLAATLAAGAQTPSPTPEMGRQPMWRCELPAGIYEVAVRSMLSVSSHEYIVDGAARVTEVNVDTPGALVVRFYYIEAISPTSPIGLGQSVLDKAQELTKEAISRTGQDEVWQKVVKSYPTTTHARTVEYRLSSKEDVTKIFESAETAFRLGRNTVLNMKGE